MRIGFEQVFDCCNCSSTKINDIKIIKSLIHDITHSINHHVVSEIYHQFEPIGITGIAIISASHIAIHTWPEYGYISIDVFSCSELKETEKILTVLKKTLDTKNIKYRCLSREVKV